MFNHSSEMKSGYRCQCKNCESEYGKIYRFNNRDKIREKNKKWTDNNRERKNDLQREWRKYNPEKIKEYRKRQRSREEVKMKRRQAARLRKKGLKSIELFINPFPKDVEVEYHHINNILTIPLPKNLHQSFNGKREYHRDECEYIIKSIYGLDIETLLKGYCDE